ncbi:hypothetical protein ACI48D_08275 [Massilia sp. LXY-6]|uniref:hypothetical protein n=1 Tax=Massilia sp. LXY-6 TaxID=3379823 RepID=UPI003EDE8D54
MTKPKATLSTSVQPAPAEAAAPAPAMTPASITTLPPTIRLFGATLPTLAEMIVHARLGYVLDMMAPVDQFGAAGTISLYMKLGTPEDSIVKQAQATVEAAAAQQRLQYAHDVQEAARQMLEDDAKAKRAAEVAAEVAATRAKIKALEASLQA